MHKVTIFAILLFAFNGCLAKISINLDILTGSIDAGSSLTGTTVEGLKESKYSVAVSGSVENYSTSSMRLDECEIASGYVNVPMQNVASGQKEAFASHKGGNSATGTWVRCSFKVKDELVHFMYSAPYSFDLHLNTLALAVCSASSADCYNLNANKMYYGNKSFMTRHQYYRTIKEISQCGQDFCIRGTMGNNHKPTLHLKLFPTTFEKLAVAAQGKVKGRWDPKDYEKFITDYY